MKKFTTPEKWPVGTKVEVRIDNGTLIKTVTTSYPWQLGHGQWVVCLQGISGGYDCERVKKAVQ